MTQRGSTDPIVKNLQRKGMPVTIENWVAMAYPEGPPENWQQEADVPLELRDDLERYLNENPQHSASGREALQNEEEGSLVLGCNPKRDIA